MLFFFVTKGQTETKKQKRTETKAKEQLLANS